MVLSGTQHPRRPVSPDINQHKIRGREDGGRSALGNRI